MKPTILPSRQAPFIILTQKLLLACGIFSSLLYVVMNVVTAMLYEGYDFASQTVSELSAVDAPTRPLWVVLAIFYSLFVIAFGVGVRRSAAGSRYLDAAGVLFIVDGIIGFFWPPMHQREVIAAGGGTLTDTMHIIFTIVQVFIMILIIAFGAAAIGKWFRLYSSMTLILLLVSGILTGMDSPKLEANLPTPGIGVWERISIGVYMLWVILLAIVLLRRGNRSWHTDSIETGEVMFK